MRGADGGEAFLDAPRVSKELRRELEFILFAHESIQSKNSISPFVCNHVAERNETVMFYIEVE